MSNPIGMLYNDAHDIQGALREGAGNLAMAIEQLASMRQAHQSAKDAYESAEAEFLFELAFNDEGYRTAKNAEGREVVKDRALVAARQAGALAAPWRILNETRSAFDNAQMAYEQAEVRFKAVRVAGELMAAQLIALAADVRFVHGEPKF